MEVYVFLFSFYIIKAERKAAPTFIHVSSLCFCHTMLLQWLEMYVRKRNRPGVLRRAIKGRYWNYEKQIKPPPFHRQRHHHSDRSYGGYGPSTGSLPSCCHFLPSAASHRYFYRTIPWISSCPLGLVRCLLIREPLHGLLRHCCHVQFDLFYFEQTEWGADCYLVIDSDSASPDFVVYPHFWGLGFRVYPYSPKGTAAGVSYLHIFLGRRAPSRGGMENGDDTLFGEPPLPRCCWRCSKYLNSLASSVPAM
jgi:hypothetical protein